MKQILLNLFVGITGFMLFGCSSNIKMAKSEYSQGVEYGDNRQRTKAFVYGDSEAFNSPPSSEPLYERKMAALSDNSTPEESMESEQKIDQEIENLKHELIQTPAPVPVQQSQPQIPEKSPKKAVKQKRLVTYEGAIVSRSIRPDSLINKAVAFAESLKGYVESRDAQTVTIRIPVNSFGIMYDSLLTYGEVIDYQRSSEDITDAYRDTDLRIAVLEKTIERYVKLIHLVKEEKDKIALLKEIERLREELESLRVQKSVLSLRAEFAKIAYTVQQITTGFAGVQQSNEIQGFEWISRLDPINAFRFGNVLKMSIPDGMVQLKDRDFWITQSPTGSRIWTASVPNKPAGTSDFWINAVMYSLRGQYLFVDTSSVSGYRFIHCTPQPGVNYRYSAGIKVVGESVHIIQCFFPDETQKMRYFDNFKKVLVADGGKS